MSYRHSSQDPLKSIISSLTEPQIKQYQKLVDEAWKSIVVLITLPGGFPLCYAATSTLLYLNHDAWQELYNQLKLHIARYIYTNSGHKSEAPFTWGFRSFNPDNMFSIDDEKTQIFIWNYICTNIFIDPLAKKQFLNGIRTYGEEHNMKEIAYKFIEDIEEQKEIWRIWPSPEQFAFLTSTFEAHTAPSPKTLCDCASIKGENGTYFFGNLMRCYKKTDQVNFLSDDDDDDKQLI